VADAVSMAEGHSEKHKEGVGEFIQKTRGELEKTSFPSRDDVQKTVAIVIVSVIFFAAYLFVVDRIWAYLIDGLGWLVEKLMSI
jgi:preprotein translocase SecE subunit